MINRILLRIKIVQILYSYYKDGSKSIANAEKELFFSIEKTYELYNLLLLLIIEITRFAEKRIEIGRNKFRPTEEELHPNTRFIDNRFVKQLASNKQLLNYVKSHKISWVNEPELIKKIFEQIASSEEYVEYMTASACSYEDDKAIWRKLFNKILLISEDLETSLEEQSIYWNDDLDIVISFITKTIKKFEEENGDMQEILPMFKDDEDAEFVRELFKKAIQNQEEYSKWIDANTKNWDFERIAFMDTLIMQIAIAELMHFPSIPISVTLNEYIEIAKTYSTEKSGNFVNGVLDNIVAQLKNENKLIKAKLYIPNEK